MIISLLELLGVVSPVPSGWSWAVDIGALMAGLGGVIYLTLTGDDF